MKNQAAINRFRELKFRRIELEVLQEQLERLRSAAAGSRDQRFDRSGVKHPASAQDRTGRQLAQIEALEHRILRRTVELERDTLDAQGLIDALPSAQRTVMLLRYIDGLPWKVIAEKMNYSVRRCMQMHEEGIRHCLRLGVIAAKPL